MIINAPISSEKLQILSTKYCGLLNSGVDASKILVIVQNSIQKNKFLQNILNICNKDSFETPLIYSFNSLVYNTISDNWAYIESNLKGNGQILPNLNGLEITQFIMKDILKDVKFKGYNSKKSLLHQIFRRYSLIVQNNLSDDEIKWRSENVLKEGFAEDAKIAIQQLLAKTLNLRSLDYLRQSLIFNHIYKNTEYFKNIKYLIIDNADEMTPLCFDFIEFLKPRLKDTAIACDSLGSSRSGYLSADKNIFKKLEKLFQGEIKEIPAQTIMFADAQTLYSNVINEKYDKLKNFSYLSPSKRSTMIDIAITKIKDLINSGVKASEISIVTPVIDEMLKFQLKENIPSHIANLLYLSGSEKLIQNSILLATLNVLKLTSKIKSQLTEYDIRAILNNLLHIPVKYSKDILEQFKANQTLIDYKFSIEEYDKNYSKFLKLVSNLNESKLGLSDRFLLIYNDFINLSDKTIKEINRFTFCIKQIQDFESVFTKEVILEKTEEIINQIENSIISENPYGILNLEDNDLIISTPQKIIDNEIQTKFQIWLDVSSSEWIKNDSGPLYNAWVFQKDWEKDEYTISDEIELSKQKNARILRKLVLCSNDKIYAYSSLFDSLGVENFGGIEKYINFEKEPNTNTWKIIPRDDQKPILAYTNGKMAISAVPGAGKTTILLSLIIELLQKGVSPESIYVLTYMESAARNFRERIKNVCQDLTSLPNISTIHGLALKILKDNANFERLNLTSDFEICDDTKRYNIIQEISQSLKLKKTETEEFDRAISVLKLSNGNTELKINDNKMQKFLTFYNEYQKILKAENIIDYDDMLSFSVKLLEDNEDILHHYQNICEFIIEDEAQDSSSIQQQLINLISKKHKNLIRCGDINQAITTTFSNADVEGFRKFIKENNSVEMNCSQRCAKEIYTLANNLVNYAKTEPEMKNAFYNIIMSPVEGKNPEEKNSISALLFKTQQEEKNYILKQIRMLLEKTPNSTIGVLLRSNYQVSNWMKLIDEAGFKAISRSESLEQKAVFKTIFAVLKIVQHPFENNILAESYETLASLGFYKTRLQLEIKNSKTPFIEQNVDNISDINLSTFYWDITYWLTFSTLPLDELCIKIGFHYFSSEIEKSNVYLISTLIKRLSASNKTFDTVMQRFEELSKKSNLSGFKFFSENDESDLNFLKGKIQIMTYHKSKGDEFDYVFIPEFAEKTLTLDINDMKLKSSSTFIENVRKLNSEYVGKNEEELKKDILEENLRLLYVAITRAKRKLYFSCSTTEKYFGNEKEQKENLIFADLLKTKEVE